MAMSRAASIFGAIAFATLLLLPSGGEAQSMGIVPGRDLPEWLETWSPLFPQGDLPRRLPSASVAMPLLLLPPPKVGLFWNGGNPAALPWEADDQRSDIVASRSVQSGSYRRPLDPASSALTQFNGTGWQTVPAGAVMGRAIFDRNVRNPSSVADVNEPYASTPFVVTDTSSAALRQTRARLEGAGGWRLGDWGLGLALGYDTRNTATISSPLVRRNRAVTAAGTVGIARTFSSDRVRIGVRGEWRGGEESLSLLEFAQQGFLYLLEGYREVPGRDFLGLYQRRMTEEMRSAGASVGGRAGAVKWVAYGDGARFRERLTSEERDDPASDLWATTGRSGGAAVQLPLFRGRTTLTVTGRLATLTGHAEQVLPSRAGYLAHERVGGLRAELRLAPTASGWTGVMSGSLLAEHRERNDSIAKASAVVDGTTPAVAVEVGRIFGDQLMIAGGYAIAGYSGSGTIPSASSSGALYKRVFAPELDIATSGARSQALSLAARWHPRTAAAFWLAGRYERLNADARAAPLVPSGSREATSVWLGVTLTP